jgi:hypothetical protein
MDELIWTHEDLSHNSNDVEDHEVEDNICDVKLSTMQKSIRNVRPYHYCYRRQ